MTPTELYQAGQLSEAITAQTAEVKAHPADHARRLFLFELLAFSGDLDRAAKQIDVLEFDEPELQAAAKMYRLLIDAESKRRQMTNGLAPGFLGQPSEHAQLRWEAYDLLRLGRAAEAVAILDRADASAPPFEGHLNGTPFQQLRDADDLLGSVLEVMAKGNYFWVPLDQIRLVAANPPRFPRDLLYLPAQLELKDGTAGEVFLPTLYPNSHQHTNDDVKLGRFTDWVGGDGQPVRGQGLKTFLVDEGDITLLEWRQLEGRDAAP